MIDSLVELRQFYQVAQSGSFSAAAGVLEQTPAAVSAGVKRLESSLQVRLFERSTRSVRLTSEGGMFLTKVAQVLTELDLACESLGHSRDTLQGHISIASASDFARGTLNQWVGKFLDLHPDISVEIRVGDGLADLQRSAIDLAVRFGQPADSSLIARPLSMNRQVACASPEYLKQHGEPRHPCELVNHECLRYHAKGQLQSQWYFHQQEQTFTVDVKGKLSSDDSSLARLWAIEGKGIVYKSELDVKLDIEDGRLVPILTDYVGSASPLYLVYPSRENLPRRIHTMIGFLLQQCS